MNTGITIREARPGDTGSVCDLCRRMDPDDYVPLAWEKWAATPGELLLVAENSRKIIGCVRAGPTAEKEVFSQGIRVDPLFWRSGVGRGLMLQQRENMRQQGVTVIRGVTGASNHKALKLFRTVGLFAIGGVTRRHKPGWRPGTDRPELFLPEKAVSLAHAYGLVPSRPGLAYYLRIHFSPTRQWLENAARRGLLLGTVDGACALLDPPSPGHGTWVIALAGPPLAVKSLLVSLRPPEGRSAPGLTVDAPSNPEIQRVLDELGFKPPSPRGRYILLRGTTGRDAVFRGRQLKVPGFPGH